MSFSLLVLTGRTNEKKEVNFYNNILKSVENKEIMNTSLNKTFSMMLPKYKTSFSQIYDLPNTAQLFLSVLVLK